MYIKSPAENIQTVVHMTVHRKTIYKLCVHA